MSNDLPSAMSDPDRAHMIVTNYLGRKYGAVPLGKLERALSEIARLYRSGIRHPLLLANKVIDIIERGCERSKAA